MKHATLYAYGAENAAAINNYLNSAVYTNIVTKTGVTLDMFFGPLAKAPFDIVIAPGNSYGIMTGGFDQGLVDLFGPQLEDRVQHLIRTKHAGELNVGAAIFVKAKDHPHRYCIYAPTMRVPKSLPKDSDIPFLATRAGLLTIHKEKLDKSIDTPPKVLIPLMGVGTGGLSVKSVLMQIHLALDSVVNPRRVTEFDQVNDVEEAIRIYGR